MNKISKEDLLNRELLEDEVLIRKILWNDAKTEITVLYTDRTWEAITILKDSTWWNGRWKKINGKDVRIDEFLEFAKIPKYWKDNCYVYKMTKDEFLDYIDCKIIEWKNIKEAK